MKAEERSQVFRNAIEVARGALRNAGAALLSEGGEGMQLAGELFALSEVIRLHEGDATRRLVAVERYVRDANKGAVAAKEEPKKRGRKKKEPTQGELPNVSNGTSDAAHVEGVAP